MSTTDSHPALHDKCPKCNPKKKVNAKNLVVCIDGTSNEFGRTNTNVVEMSTQVDQKTERVKQSVYYSSGIGTDPRPRNILGRMAFSNKIDMAFALSVKKNVMEAYAWLAAVYTEGDQIYLFGFSRGAYQVRVLASMIHEIGLLKVPTEKQIIKAYDYYSALQSGHPMARGMAKKFKDAFSFGDTRVHFVGVWDTVCSVNGENLLSASSSAEQACHFRHALALDERRVMFMPEYFYRVNSRTDPAMSNKVDPTISDKVDLSESRGKGNGTPDVKEVWFSGCHSDVGGGDGNKESHRAGNVSLLWMRQEATKNGLVLRPTDLVWVPSDIDFGVNESMTPAWRLLEYMPITHQVSFSSDRGNARRWHRMQPRRIIPGQKVHASILYANAYEPRASLGGGFDVPMDHFVPHPDLDKQFWETEFFDDTGAQELLIRLDTSQGAATIYLDRLLFMLRFEEGKQSFRNMEDWERKFRKLINNRERPPLVRLGIIIAYYDVLACDPGTDSKAPQGEELKQILDDAKRDFSSALDRRQGNTVTVLAFVRYLAKYKDLREHISIQDALSRIMNLFDEELRRPVQTGFILAIMDALTCLLQCEDTRETVIQELGYPDPRYSKLFERFHARIRPLLKLDGHSRLYKTLRILEFLDSQFLPAALRMVMCLARIPEARSLCLTVKPRLRRLARRDKRRTGLLSAEILLILYDPDDQQRLNIRSANVRANLAGALAHFSTDTRDSVDEKSRDTDPVQHALGRLFGTCAELTGTQEKHIRELKAAVRKGNVRERTAATLTLLKLCETERIRTFLREIKLVDVFIRQLKRKDSALLAARALVTCLTYNDMKGSIENNKLVRKNIAYMLQHNYFDDAIGQAEGFRTFKDLMQHDGLREKTRKHNIAEALSKKLLKRKPRETHTSLMCLDILRSVDENAPYTEGLVEKSLEYLRKPRWKAQKTGLIILSALAQTEHGVETVGPRIPEIIKMLLPDQSTASTSAANPSEGPIQPGVIPQVLVNPTPSDPSDVRPKQASRLLGPACALWILGLNKELRDRTRDTPEYNDLKLLFLNGTLFGRLDTPSLLVYTPDQADVMDMLYKMFKVVDEELPDESLASIRDVILPHIQHWDKFGDALLDWLVGLTLQAGALMIYIPLAAAMIGVLTGIEGALLGIGIGIGTVGMVVLVPAWLLRELLECYHSFRLKNGDDPDAHEGDGAPSGQADEGSGSGEGGKGGKDGKGSEDSESGEDSKGAKDDKGAKDGKGSEDGKGGEDGKLGGEDGEGGGGNKPGGVGGEASAAGNGSQPRASRQQPSGGREKALRLLLVEEFSRSVYAPRLRSRHL